MEHVKSSQSIISKASDDNERNRQRIGETQRSSTESRNVKFNRRVSIKGTPRSTFLKMKLSIPPEDDTRHFSNIRYTKRFESDQIYATPTYSSYQTIKADPTFIKYVVNDDADTISAQPSFTTFRIPYHMICRERYLKAIEDYKRQFQHEIDQLIEYQATAREALYFVRIVAYTTLWPPLHNTAELNWCNKHVFQLTPKEKKRYDQIMSKDIC